MPPELSVIVATHNRRPLLERCLTALGSQSASPESFEVIVVVDGSTDGTADWLAQLTPRFRCA